MVEVTKVMIENFLKTYELRMDMPESFLGTECNTYGEWGRGKFYKSWDSSELSFLVASPWNYRDFVGNQSGPLLYKLINEYSRLDGSRPFIAERSYMPFSKKDLNAFIKNGIPIFGLESKKVMGYFDVVGFSLGFAPFMTNVVKQLVMSGIPIRWRDREDMKESYPLIVSGGSTYGSPEPWSPVVDFMFIGEVEEEKDSPGLMSVLEDINKFKKEAENYYSKNGREELLHFLARKYDFLYIPKFIYPKYKSVNKELFIEKFDTKYEDIPKRIKKRFVKDLNAVPCVDDPPIPWISPEMGTGEVELARGCNSGVCIFCAVGFRYRPYRERSIDYMEKALRENIKNTGAVGAFPTAFEYTGYTKKNLLTKIILEKVSDNFDSQSQRIDNVAIDSNFALLSGEGGMKQLAVGVEGCSERLRTFVSKGAPKEVILKACENVIKGGYKRLKLYLINNLPYETNKDIEEFLKLCEEIVYLKNATNSKVRIKVSFTPLLIEAWTPLQWFPCKLRGDSLIGINEKLKKLNIEFSLGKKIKKDYAWSTQVFHLCDRLGGEALIDTYEELDSVYFGLVDLRMSETLEKNLKKYGVSYEYYFKEKPKDYIFGWDHIDVGVTKEYMYGLYKKAVGFMKDSTIDSRGLNKNGFLSKKCFDGCSDCGVCNTDEDKKAVRDVYEERKNDINMKDLSTLKIINESSLLVKLRLKVFINEKYRFIGNDYWKALIRRAAWHGGIPINKYSLKFVSDSVKYKNWVYGIDYLEFGLLHKCNFDMSYIINIMNKELVPYGIEFKDGMFVDVKIGKLKKHSGYSFYKMSTDRNLDSVKNALNFWRRAKKIETVLYSKNFVTGLMKESINIKEYVKDIWAVVDGASVYLKFYAKGKVSPFDVYRALFNLRLNKSYEQFAERIESFIVFKDMQVDFFRASCECGKTIPVNFLEKVLNKELCPKCTDKNKMLNVF